METGNRRKIKFEAYMEKWTNATRKIPEIKWLNTNEPVATKIGTIRLGTFHPGDQRTNNEGLLYDSMHLFLQALRPSQKSLMFLLSVAKG